MEPVDQIRAKFEMLAPVMDERMLRLWAAAEAKVLGRGQITFYTGLSNVRRSVGQSRVSGFGYYLQVG